jgi:tetrahydromethanopterin S-methyltransferase subunit B
MGVLLMTVLICHPGTGTIIDASDDVYILVLEDDDETTSEEIESAMSDFYRMVAPKHTILSTFAGAVDHFYAKRM